MNEEEIKEYLKRVDELEERLVEEDKETLEWLIFGYNQCAKLLNESEKEIIELKEVTEYWQNACNKKQDKIFELLAKLEGDK